ncbi:hypothetical protein C1280_10290 [Gemmata obscuriglobus]|uniref:Uncharacterized protein n=1 Tax=Gemmata obscuriglobus TaxID=114 RepID=A0A2Z3GSJ7_9BACT|nr:hypothetical protein C1280_10290 [Gemmata obscuriglobus]
MLSVPPRNRRGHRAEPGAAPDTAREFVTHRSLGGGGAGELYVRSPSRSGARVRWRCACGPRG